jgi:hypothetical protein
MVRKQRTYGHFDVVKIETNSKTIELEIADADGVVLGITHPDGSTAADAEDWYAVLITSVGRTVMLRAIDLGWTGRRADPATIYDGTSVHVSDQGHM